MRRRSARYDPFGGKRADIEIGGVPAERQRAADA
jgi:hypothetical protein